MFNCSVRATTPRNPELVSRVFNVEGRRVLVRKIPALVCGIAGKQTFMN